MRRTVFPELLDETLMGNFVKGFLEIQVSHLFFSSPTFGYWDDNSFFPNSGKLTEFKRLSVNVD